MTELHRATAAEADLTKRLLEEAKLPTDILTSGLGELWVMSEGKVNAVGGFEFYDGDALLRSVAVDEGHRRGGIGTRLVDALLEVARRRGVKRVWLLTETAEGFFRKKGFARVERTAIDNHALLASPEFTHVCATTAVCMVKDLR